MIYIRAQFEHRGTRYVTSVSVPIISVVIYKSIQQHNTNQNTMSRQQSQCYNSSDSYVYYIGFIWILICFLIVLGWTPNCVVLIPREQFCCCPERWLEISVSSIGISSTMGKLYRILAIVLSNTTNNLPYLTLRTLIV